MTLVIGFRSRREQNEYMNVPKQFSPTSNTIISSKPITASAYANTEPTLSTIEQRSSYSNIMHTIKTNDEIETASHYQSHNFEASTNTTNEINTGPMHESMTINGDQETESSYESAHLMLREVKAMLLQNRPDRAIAHVQATMDVDFHNAAKFVADVDNNIIG